VKIIEIAGNDDIFVTALMPNAGPPKFAGVRSVMTMTLPDGRVRQGLAVKVPDLIPLLNAVRIQGGTVEHVYDY
jgi:hypothetical protein